MTLTSVKNFCLSSLLVIGTVIGILYLKLRSIASLNRELFNKRTSSLYRNAKLKD